MLTASDVVSFAPDAATVAASQLTAFMRYCEAETGEAFADYTDFEEFSVRELQSFWGLFLQWSNIRGDGSTHPVCTDVTSCEDAVFFPALRLSYVENLLRIDGPEDAERLAVVAHHATGPPERVSRGALRDRVLRLSSSLRQIGIGPGDRVVAIARNNIEALVAGLATAAVGATFSSVAPDLGAATVLDRFEQLGPVALFASLATDQEPESTELSNHVGEIVRRLQTVQAVIALDEGPAPEGLAVPLHRLSRLLEDPAGPRPAGEFERFPFNHPLFILFSSGTTGPPKGIVHGAGGTLLEHLKEHRLHVDLRSSDILFFQTSTAWMMWNWQLSALACGAAIVVYDGPISGPDTLWNVVEAAGVTVFGTSPPYLQLCEDGGFSPRDRVQMPALRALLSTGSILHDDQYDWVRDHVGAIPLQSISGGTDIIGCFVLGNPNLPVCRGLIQCRSLGLDVQAMPTSRTPSNSPIGELVCRNPFPSRPVGLVADDGRRFHETYFSQAAGVWTHGDLVEFTSGGHARLHGRSDGILNVRGIRVGPAEIYRALRDISEISEAMAVEQQTPDGADPARLVLLVVLAEPGTLNAELIGRIRRELFTAASPAHVPQVVIEVDELPVTHSGKRSERAARDALNGMTAVNAEALRNPASLARIVTRLGDADLALAHQVAAPRDFEGVSTEARLQVIWEAVLDIAPLRPDDNFFEVGGTSLAAVRLLNAIRERLGVDLPISTLLQAQTIAKMAAVVDGAGAADEEDFPLVLLLKPGIGTVPLFVVHGMHGDVLQMRSLAQLMKTDRPVYGLRSRGLNPAAEPQVTVEEMAEDFVRHVWAIQPTGPYAFAGYSFGGLVAFEMACLMTQAGEAMESLILLDTYLHDGCLPPLARRRFQALRALRGARVALRTRWRARTGSALDLRDPAAAGQPSPLPSGEAMPPRWVHLGEINMRAFETYRPTAYSGTATLVRAADRLGEYCDTTPVWTRLAQRGLLVEPLGCAHDEMFSPPHVEVLADLLTAHLDHGGRADGYAPTSRPSIDARSAITRASMASRSVRTMARSWSLGSGSSQSS